MNNHSLILGFLMLILTVSYCFAQDSLVIQEEIQQVSIDPLSNIYIITDDFEFKKYNDKGDFLYSYTDLELSELSNIASDHPFKSMVYYPEYNLIRVFGNRLQVLAELNLNSYVFGEVTAVAPANGYQSFWVFDATDQKLIRINQNYQVEQESQLQNMLEQPFFPTVMKVRESWLYAYDPDQGLFIFDNNGIFSSHVAVEGASAFSVLNQKVFFSKDGRIFELEPYLKKLISIGEPIEGKIIDMAFRNISIQSGKSLKVIKF